VHLVGKQVQIISKADGSSMVATESCLGGIASLVARTRCLTSKDEDSSTLGTGREWSLGGFHACFHFSDTHGAFLGDCSGLQSFSL
jgi:hypothetical protein